MTIRRATLAGALALTRAEIADMFQYRVVLFLYSLWEVVHPIVYLAVWGAIAGDGDVGGLRLSDFAAYYLTFMLVSHVTAAIEIYTFGPMIQQGELSPHLLRPMNPVWVAAARNISYKSVSMLLLIPVWIGLVIILRPSFTITAASVPLFVVALVVAALLSFLDRHHLRPPGLLDHPLVFLLGDLDRPHLPAGRSGRAGRTPARLRPEPRHRPAHALHARLPDRGPAQPPRPRRTRPGIRPPVRLAHRRRVGRARRLAGRHPPVLRRGRLTVRILRIVSAFLRAAILKETAYRAELVGNLFRSVIGIGVAIGGLAVVFSHTSDLSGWRLEQAMVLLGVYYLVQGIVQTALSPSLNEVVSEVRKGTFDYVLLKPVPSLLLSSTRRFVVWHVADVALGGTIIAVGLIRLEAQITFGVAAVFAGVMVGGVAIVFSIWLALTTLVFWFVRVENITMIFQLFFDTGRYPVEIYPFWLRSLLTFVFPVAFITTVPAQTITGREPLVAIWLAPVIGVLALLAAARFWRIGLSRYTSASS